MSDASYHIRTQQPEPHYLTDARAWSRRKERRCLMDYRTALALIEEARKWCPDAIIVAEV